MKSKCFTIFMFLSIMLNAAPNDACLDSMNKLAKSIKDFNVDSTITLDGLIKQYDNLESSCNQIQNTRDSLIYKRYQFQIAHDLANLCYQNKSYEQAYNFILAGKNYYENTLNAQSLYDYLKLFLGILYQQQSKTVIDNDIDESYEFILNCASNLLNQDVDLYRLVSLAVLEHYIPQLSQYCQINGSTRQYVVYNDRENPLIFQDVNFDGVKDMVCILTDTLFSEYDASTYLAIFEGTTEGTFGKPLMSFNDINLRFSISKKGVITLTHQEMRSHIDLKIRYERKYVNYMVIGKDIVNYGSGADNSNCSFNYLTGKAIMEESFWNEKIDDVDNLKTTKQFVPKLVPFTDSAILDVEIIDSLFDAY